MNQQSIFGLIPARAGNTVWLSSCRACVWAHPRSRGEHDAQSHGDIIESGSSPLARGTRQSGAGKLTRRGLIPARAGNTGRVAVTGGVRRAHPRSRGEHMALSAGARRVSGSSPLARGTPGADELITPLNGLIPARAGNTGYGFCGADHAWAHPRSRGEHHVFFAVDKPNPGSSPLARGTR